jgi:hypothetical protein
LTAANPAKAAIDPNAIERADIPRPVVALILIFFQHNPSERQSTS